MITWETQSTQREKLAYAQQRAMCAAIAGNSADAQLWAERARELNDADSEDDETCEDCGMSFSKCRCESEHSNG